MDHSACLSKLIASLALAPVALVLLAATALAQGPGFWPGPDCDVRFGKTYTETISGSYAGDDINLEVSSQFGGAVSSVIWRGKEFINVADHGRQISYAWHMNDLGECLNPTEPGSSNDGTLPTSTTNLTSVCSNGTDSLTTTANPAFWLAPRQRGYCSGGATTAQNTTLVSNHELNKTITIGYQGLPNVIVFDAEITTPEDYDVLQAEIPTAYLTHEFSARYTYDPYQRELVAPLSDHVDPAPSPWDYQHYTTLPVILSTPDGSHAFGAYTAESIVNYGLFHSPSPDPDNETNKWHMVAREEPAPAGTYNYRSFAIIGTLEQVQKTMSYLFDLEPTDPRPPQGTLDVADCTQFAGWAWDPKIPDQPIDVEVLRIYPDGSTRLIMTILADDYREDLERVLGDNGRHGFVIPAVRLLGRNGGWDDLRFQAVTSIAGLPSTLIDFGEVHPRCRGAF